MAKKLKKVDLIEAVAKAGEISKTEAEKAVNRTFDGLLAVTETMEVDDELQLVGLATYTVVESKARVGKHPKTQAEIKIPAKKSIKCKLGKNFQDAVVQ